MGLSTTLTDKHRRMSPTSLNFFFLLPVDMAAQEKVTGTPRRQMGPKAESHLENFQLVGISSRDRSLLL